MNRSAHTEESKQTHTRSHRFIEVRPHAYIILVIHSKNSLVCKKTLVTIKNPLCLCKHPRIHPLELSCVLSPKSPIYNS